MLKEIRPLYGYIPNGAKSQSTGAIKVFKGTQVIVSKEAECCLDRMMGTVFILQKSILFLWREKLMDGQGSTQKCVFWGGRLEKAFLDVRVFNSSIQSNPHGPLASVYT